MLEQSIQEESFVREDIHALAATDDRFFSKLLALFIHVHFDEEKAKEYWQDILVNQREMTDALQRQCDPCLAILDYFTRVVPVLSTPLLIESKLFRQTEKLVMTDHLTKLFNRRYFDITLSKEMRRAIRYKKTLSVTMIDLDNFKKINDTYGHVFGDLVLENFASTILRITRQEDIVCRYGGEEFVILLPEVNAGGAMCLFKRIRENLRSIPLFAEKHITFSAGIACYPDHLTDENPQSIVLAADHALYQAKQTGKDKAVVYSEDEKKEAKQTYHIHRWSIQYEMHTVKGPFILKNCVTHSISNEGVRLEADECMQGDDILIVTITKEKGSPEEEACRIQAKVILGQPLDEKRFVYELKFQTPAQDQRTFLDQIKSNTYFSEES
jgi:diguanylate cyclase (GGDEF)-like protein